MALWEFLAVMKILYSSMPVIRLGMVHRVQDLSLSFGKKEQDEVLVHGVVWKKDEDEKVKGFLH